MDFEKNRLFGQHITKLINKEDLSQGEAFESFSQVLKNEVSEMQQGAFLAALTAKGQTAGEVAGGWKAVYELDTNKVDLNGLQIVDNCGTGMDSFKTFNISTGASLIAAAGDVKVARHGARAITSACGTVDMAEALGVDMECPVELVAKSIEQAGIGLFNGMSPEVHPMALGRILSQICFGSPLNVAASLAHPALPKLAVRGVYAKELLMPVAEVMQAIGYEDALVIYGGIDGSEQGMDEASVCGTSSVAHLRDGKISEYQFEPEEVGLARHDSKLLAAEESLEIAVKKMFRLLSGKGEQAQTDALLLNSALIFHVQKTVPSIEAGVEKARDIVSSGAPISTLRRWVEVQNRKPEEGLKKFTDLADSV